MIFTVCCAGTGQPTAGVGAVGVQVYVVVAWLLKAGAQVPKAPFCVATGNTKLPLTQTLDAILKEGEEFGTMVIVT